MHVFEYILPLYYYYYFAIPSMIYIYQTSHSTQNHSYIGMAGGGGGWVDFDGGTCDTWKKIGALFQKKGELCNNNKIIMIIIISIYTLYSVCHTTHQMHTINGNNNNNNDNHDDHLHNERITDAELTLVCYCFPSRLRPSALLFDCMFLFYSKYFFLISLNSQYPWVP